VEAVADNGQHEVLNGTSIAAPLWAGFNALVNQQSAANGGPRVGFLNPALYAIGKGSGYTRSFHDVTVGNTTSRQSPRGFFAEVGYDLCTGWGVPTGSNLINALLLPPTEALQISPELGFFASGPSGGPYNVSSQDYTLTNAGSAPLDWTLATPPPWLAVSATNGVLAPGGPAATLTVSLSPEVAKVLIGSMSGNVWFTNTTSGSAQSRQFFFSAGNGGFETGDFTDWNLTGISNIFYNFTVDSGDKYFGITNLPGVDDGTFVHSGAFGGFFGENGSISHLSQTLPTVPGEKYLFSFWLDNTLYQGSNTPNSFLASWGGGALFASNNMPAFSWTNMQFVVSASGARTTVQFGFRNDPAAFGLDDISVQQLVVPDIQSATVANGAVTLVWSALPGAVYQVQTEPDLSLSNWTVAKTLKASDATATATFPATTSGAVFYRVALVP
jgi:hypothetical protein